MLPRMKPDRRALLTAGATALMLPRGADARPGAPTSVSRGIEERSLADLSADIAAGRTSARRLVAAYRERIARIDRAGPRLASVI